MKLNNRVVKAPEYETLGTAGSNCGVGDFEAVTEFRRRGQALRFSKSKVISGNTCIIKCAVK